MAAPTMGQYGNALQVAGAAYQTVGSYFAARTQKQNLKAQQRMAEHNARMAERGAQSALLAGERQIGAATLAHGQKNSVQRARLAANGVDLSEGSAAEVQASGAIVKDWEMQDLRLAALYQALGYREQAGSFMNQAFAAKAQNKALNPWMQTAGTLLTSASSAMQGWNFAGGGK